MCIYIYTLKNYNYRIPRVKQMQFSVCYQTMLADQSFNNADNSGHCQPYKEGTSCLNVSCV